MLCSLLPHLLLEESVPTLGVRKDVNIVSFSLRGGSVATLGLIEDINIVSFSSPVIYII